MGVKTKITNYMTNANGDPTSHKKTHKIRCQKLSIRMLRLVEPPNNLFGMVVDHNFFHVGLKALRWGSSQK